LDPSILTPFPDRGIKGGDRCGDEEEEERTEDLDLYHAMERRKIKGLAPGIGWSLTFLSRNRQNRRIWGFPMHFNFLIRCINVFRVIIHDISPEEPIGREDGRTLNANGLVICWASLGKGFIHWQIIP
jgi:hypothetical protein